MAKDTKSQKPEKAPNEVPEEAATKDAPSDGEGSAHGEPETPPSGSHTVTIDGEGTTPVIGENNVVRTVERGVPIEVSDAELAYLKTADLPFKAGKKS